MGPVPFALSEGGRAPRGLTTEPRGGKERFRGVGRGRDDRLLFHNTPASLTAQGTGPELTIAVSLLRDTPLDSQTTRLVMRHFQAAVFLLLGAAGVILFAPSRTDRVSGAMPKGLPKWFQDLDTNGDGQVSLREWLAGGRP